VKHSYHFHLVHGPDQKLHLQVRQSIQLALRCIAQIGTSGKDVLVHQSHLPVLQKRCRQFASETTPAQILLDMLHSAGAVIFQYDAPHQEVMSEKVSCKFESVEQLARKKHLMDSVFCC
jgi:hypothetical protein